MAKPFDWTPLVENEFDDIYGLDDLYNRHFFGKVVINFQNGEPKSVNVEQTHISKSERTRRRDGRIRRSNSLYPEGYGDNNTSQYGGFVAKNEGQ